MKSIIYFILAVITTSVFAVQPQTKYSGLTYEIEIVRDHRSVTKGCITFHEGGRFTMSDESLTMLWLPQVNFPNKFMAVTAPRTRSVVPYHRGVYGEVLADNTLQGRGIDQGGSKFQFYGKPKDECDARRSERVARNANQVATGERRVPGGRLPVLNPCWLPPGQHAPCDPIPDPMRASNPVLDGPIRISDPCQLTDGSWTPCDPVPDPTRAANPIVDGPIRISDPCQLADGSWTPCDPIPDPLRGDVQNVEPDALAGRSFRLTLGASDRSVVEYCWTFTSKHTIEYAKLGRKGYLTWSPDNNQSYNAGFFSTGAGTDGQGMAYHGTLVGDNLLEVVGIEARDGNSLVTYGFGQEVASCK